jgi:hypothetical protein
MLKSIFLLVSLLVAGSVPDAYACVNKDPCVCPCRARYPHENAGFIRCVAKCNSDQQLQMNFFSQPITAFATQACLERNGELHLASVEGSKRGEEFGMEYDLIQENRIRLNDKAPEICSGDEFCIEDTSIKTTFFFHPWTRVGRGSMTAVVNCLE